jgi:hypothetical protein
MADNPNRLDLGADLDKVSKDFLKDVEAAAKEVKQRKAADREKDRRSATRAKDRKLSVVIIAAAVLVLILIAWMVSARAPQATTPIVAPSTAANPKITAPVVRTAPPKAPVRPATGQDSAQRNQQQPYGDDAAPGQ